MLAPHHPRLICCLGLLLWAPAASAEPVQTAPGRSLQIRTCAPDPADPCWETASAISRFAAQARTNVDPVLADVRIAHQGQTLLVRAQNLPEESQLEIIVGTKRHGGSADAAVLVAGEGLHSLALGPAKLEATIRSLSVHLREMDTGIRRTWAPHGHGDAHRAGEAWFSDGSPSHTLTAQSGPEGLTLQAPGATELRLVQRRPLFPTGGRGVPTPWSIHARSKLGPIKPPFSGWHDLVAVWREPGGDVEDLQHRSLFLQAEGPPGGQAHGIHPAPQALKLHDGPPFVLKDGARFCTGKRTWRPAVRLARAALERTTGLDLHSRCELRSYVGGIRIVTDESLPDEGFRIRSSADGVEISAKDKRGAVYGALAVADGIGPDRTLPAMELVDAPVVPWRILFHRVVVDAKAQISPETYVHFLRRAVSRGRYNAIVLNLSHGYRWSSHPELARPNAWSRKDLERVLEAAEDLGIEVIPGLAEPGHAEWITSKHPHLREDGAGYMLCTRHPDTRPLLADLMSEMIDVFHKPRYLHIGHDEMWWPTHRKHEDQRCSRCAGSPRWQLVLDDLTWHHKWLAERGVKPMMWSDMLVKDWHGKNGGIYRAGENLPEAVRQDLTVVSWTRVGDSVGSLVPLGFPVVRGHTGYTDWKRQGLVDQSKGISGEAMAVFYATPWSSFGGQAGPTPLLYHWSAVVLAGTTAWRPDLSETAIDPSLDHLASLPAYLPGLRFMSGRSAPVAIDGPTAAIDALLPHSAEVSGAPFSIQAPTEHSVDPLVIQGPGLLEGLSVLQATAFDQETERRLIKAFRRGNSINGVKVVQVEITYEDGQTGAASLRLGMDTDRADRPRRGQLLWRTSGALRVPSIAAGALNSEATDRAFHRWDWKNPRPEVPVARIRFLVTQPGVRWQVLAVTAWKPAE